MPSPPVASASDGHAVLADWQVDGVGVWHFAPLPAIVTLSTPPTPVVWLLLGLRGKCCLDSAAPLTLTAPQHALLHSPTGLTLRAEAPDTELLGLAWPAAEFAPLLQDLIAPLAGFGAALQAGASALVGPAPLSPALDYAARALLAALNSTDPLAPLWRRARLWEVVAQQLTGLTARAPAQQLSEYDRERLRFARDYLLQHTQLPPTLPELARLAGLNEDKLKRGFKALFEQPTFAYLAEWRLHEARARLLADPARTASDVAFELGYASLQHFSAAYKQRFGHSPRALRTSTPRA